MRFAIAVLAAVAALGTGALNAQQTLVEDYRFGEFSSAHSIDVDPFGNIFVSDPGTNMVYKYSIKGKELASIGGQGWDQNQFDSPMGLDASLGVAVYVADYNNNRVSRFDRDLHFLGSYSTDNDPNPAYSFGYPRDVTVSPVGDLFIIDDENRSIVYTSGLASAEFSFGGTEAGTERLEEPLALTTGTNNNVHVLEKSRVVTFDLFGNPVRAFGMGHFNDAEGIVSYEGAVIVVAPDSLHFFAQDGGYRASWGRKDFVFASDPGSFRDLAVTRTNMLLLTDQYVIVLPNPFKK